MSHQIIVTVSHAFSQTLSHAMAERALSVSALFDEALSQFFAWYDASGGPALWVPKAPPRQGADLHALVPTERKHRCAQLAQVHGVPLKSIYYSVLVRWAREHGLAVAADWDSIVVGHLQMHERDITKIRVLVAMGTFESHREFWEAAASHWIHEREAHEGAAWPYASALHNAQGASQARVQLARSVWAELQRFVALDSVDLKTIYYNMATSYLAHLDFSLPQEPST